jgi:hypothetical protein
VIEHTEMLDDGGGEEVAGLKQFHTAEGYTVSPIRGEPGVFRILKPVEYYETSVRARRIED